MPNRVFAVASGRVYSCVTQDDRFGWVDHGPPPGTCAIGPPTALSDLAAYVRGGDGTLRELGWDGDRWAWHERGAPPGSARRRRPSAMSRPSRRKARSGTTGTAAGVYRRHRRRPPVRVALERRRSLDRPRQPRLGARGHARDRGRGARADQARTAACSTTSGIERQTAGTGATSAVRSTTALDERRVGGHGAGPPDRARSPARAAGAYLLVFGWLALRRARAGRRDARQSTRRPSGGSPRRHRATAFLAGGRVWETCRAAARRSTPLGCTLTGALRGRNAGRRRAADRLFELRATASGATTGRPAPGGSGDPTALPPAHRRWRPRPGFMATMVTAHADERAARTHRGRPQPRLRRARCVDGWERRPRCPTPIGPDTQGLGARARRPQRQRPPRPGRVLGRSSCGAATSAATASAGTLDAAGNPSSLEPRQAAADARVDADRLERRADDQLARDRASTSPSATSTATAAPS